MVATSPKRGFVGRRRARPSTAFAAEHGRERAGFARALLCLAQVCPRGGDMHPAARPFLERSFFQCLRWRQASCRTCFQPGAGASRTRVCLLGRLLQCGFPVRPISAVASSNLPRSTSYTKNKQLQLIVSFYKYFGHNNSFMKAKQQKTNNNDKTMRKIHIFCQRPFTHDKPSTKS